MKTPKPLTKVEMLSTQVRSFVAITNHLTNDVSKEDLFIAEQRPTNAQANFGHIESENRRGEFIDEKISQKFKILEKACDLGVILEETFKSRVANLLLFWTHEGHFFNSHVNLGFVCNMEAHFAQLESSWVL